MESRTRPATRDASPAVVRFGVDSVARQLDLVVALLAIHLREDAVARRAAEGLERSLEPFAFALARVRCGLRGDCVPRSPTSKKSCERGSIGTCPRNAIGFSPPALPTGSILNASTMRGCFPVKQYRGHEIGPRIPERIVRIVAARMDVVDADLPIVAAVLGSQRQHVAIGNHAREPCEALPVRLIQYPFRGHVSQ